MAADRLFVALVDGDFELVRDLAIDLVSKVPHFQVGDVSP